VAQRKDRWLLRKPSRDAKYRLFCFPFSGTGASSWRRWPERIGPIDVCPIQLPGRENRIGEAGYRDIDVFADEAPEWLGEYLDRPYALFGHCQGALLAHAALRRIEEFDVRQPERLFVSSSRVPHLPPEQRYRRPAPGLTGVFHPTMSDDQLADELQRVAGTLGGALVPELMPMLVGVLRSDVEMCFGYAPTVPEPVRTPITTFGWRSDQDVPVAQMAAWDAYGQTKHRVLDVEKLSFLTAPPALLEAVREDLTITADTRPAPDAEVIR
jgi:surfactin synthase thioesterase subunit